MRLSLLNGMRDHRKECYPNITEVNRIHPDYLFTINKRLTKTFTTCLQTNDFKDLFKYFIRKGEQIPDKPLKTSDDIPSKAFPDIDHKTTTMSSKEIVDGVIAIIKKHLNQGVEAHDEGQRIMDMELNQKQIEKFTKVFLYDLEKDHFIGNKMTGKILSDNIFGVSSVYQDFPRYETFAESQAFYHGFVTKYNEAFFVEKGQKKLDQSNEAKKTRNEEWAKKIANDLKPEKSKQPEEDIEEKPEQPMPKRRAKVNGCDRKKPTVDGNEEVEEPMKPESRPNQKMIEGKPVNEESRGRSISNATKKQKSENGTHKSITIPLKPPAAP